MTTEPPRTGTVIVDRYRVGEVLGVGGMGSVYRADDTLSGRAIALKILRAELGTNDEAGARFHREAFVGTKLVHPNCVGVDDLGWCEDGAIYLAMELLEGETVAELLAREGKLPWRRALHIARHVLRGLGHAHDQDIVHRDVKPENLFLTRRDGDPDFARVLDFGIAKLVGGDVGPALTAAGLTIGTPDYLSPEQAQGVAIDGRSDLYAVSVVLYEMLTGAPPFHDDDLVKILTAHATREPPPFPVTLEIPAGVEQLVRDGLAKKPEDRIASAAAYVARIDGLLSADPDLGLVLDGRYRLEAQLGRGAWGRVYRATHVGLNKPVAVKVLDPKLVADDDARRRFEREAQAAGKLRHPNCVAVTDFGAMPDGSRYLVMELAEGEELDAVLDRETRLPVARAVHVMRHLLRGLGHAHAQGLVHRDLKPPNIMLAVEGNDRDFAKVLDFGLAKMIAGSDDRITRTGVVCGTPRYMAPEQALDRRLDGRTDLYAATVIFYEMLTGRTPFDGDSATELLRHHLEAPVPPLAEAAPDVKVPRALEDLIRRGLAKQPEDRPANAEAYLLALERASATDATIELSMLDPAVLPLAAPPPTPRPGLVVRPPPRFTRRQLGIAAAVGGILVVGLIAAIASRGSSSSTRPPAPAPDDDGLVLEAEDVPRVAPDVAAAVALAGKGREEDAAAQLEQLRKQRPDDAQVPYALGRIYKRLGWPKQTIDAYRDAARLDAALREDAVLIRDLVALLASKSAWQQAAKVLVEDVGEAAIPALTDAGAHNRDGTVRARARKLAAQLQP